MVVHGRPHLDVRYRTVTVNGLDVFYREAGDPGRPPLVLPHGFPSSSPLFRQLISALADEYHLVAPDHIGLRIASRHPERVTALISQSGNAYREGFTPFWDVLFAHGEDRAANEAEAFLCDLPDAEPHLLDAGHFALETHGPELTALVRAFLRRVDDTAAG